MDTPNTLFLALDLELEQPSREIIEVGIALGNQNIPKDSWVVRSWLITPSEPLSPFIQELCSISQAEMDEKGVSLEQCAKELSELISDTHFLFPNPVVWGEGDADCLKEAFRSKGIHFPHFGHRSIDVKGIATFTRLARGVSKPGGLKSECQAMKVPFDGKAHRAYVDAQNTLNLFFAHMRRQQALESCVSTIKSI